MKSVVNLSLCCHTKDLIATTLGPSGQLLLSEEELKTFEDRGRLSKSWWRVTRTRPLLVRRRTLGFFRLLVEK